MASVCHAPEGLITYYSEWEGQPRHLNPDPAQTPGPGPGQGTYAGVGTCLIKKQAHDSQPCNYCHVLYQGVREGTGEDERKVD